MADFSLQESPTLISPIFVTEKSWNFHNVVYTWVEPCSIKCHSTDQLSSPKVVKERRWALNTSLLPHFVRHFAVWWEEEESFNNLIFCGAMIEMDTRVQLQLIRFRMGEQVHRFECASLYNTIELSPSPLAQSHITFGAQWTF